MGEPTHMRNEFRVAGEHLASLLAPDIAHLVAYGHQLASLQSFPV
jgi:hypothetical protein